MTKSRMAEVILFDLPHMEEMNMSQKDLFNQQTIYSLNDSEIAPPLPETISLEDLKNSSSLLSPLAGQ